MKLNANNINIKNKWRYSDYMKFVIVTSAGSRLVEADNMYDASMQMTDYECNYAKCICIAGEESSYEEYSYE